MLVVMSISRTPHTSLLLYHLSSSFDFLGIVIVNRGFLPELFLPRKRALWMVPMSMGCWYSDGSFLFCRDGGSLTAPAPPLAIGLQDEIKKCSLN